MEMNNTETNFITAFWKLYAVKPVDKISVSYLCRSAGYNRATFYNHFTDIYDLFDRAVEEMFLPAKKNVFSKLDFSTILQGNMLETILLTYFTKQDQYIELIFKRNDHYILGKKLKNEILALIAKEPQDHKINIEKIDLLLEYQISAVLGVVNQWYRKEKTMPEQELLRTIYDITSKGVLNVLKGELGE